MGFTFLKFAFLLSLVATPNVYAELTDSGVHAPPNGGMYDYNSFKPGAAGHPAIGGTYVDPVFGSTIRRLTDVTGSMNGDDIYAKHQANANGTMAFWRNSSGVRIINPHTAAVLYNTAQPTGIAASEMHWDALDPDKYYYFSGSSLMRRNVSAQTNTTVKTFPSALSDNGGSLNIQTRDGRYFTVRYGGTNKLWDSQTDTIYSGAVTPLDSNGWVSVTPDGNYMVTAAGPGQTHYSYAVNHTTKTISSSFVNFWTLCGDHGALVSASDGKSYFISSNCNNVPSLNRIDITLDQTGKSPPQQAAASRVLVTVQWEDAGHFSCVSKGANQDWCFYATESVIDTYNSSTAGWTAFKQEIIAMNVITGEVKRFAHHRSRSINTNYANMPRVSSSWDGSVVMWVSNFNNNNPVGYADMYSISNPLGASTPPPVDTAAPTVPANVTATAVSTTQINLSWTASTDNMAVTGYNIYRGATKVGIASATTYADTGLTANTNYTYQVEAYDAAGNTSAKSTAVSRMTMAADTTAPTVSNPLPSGILASGTTSSVLSVATNESATCKYSLSSGVAFASMTLSLTPAASGLTHSVAINGLSDGQVYNYYVRCRDTAMNANMSDTLVTFSVNTAVNPGVAAPTNFRVKSRKLNR